MFRLNCIVCGSKKLDKILDLGMHPYADTFLKKKDLSLSEPIYPLICDLCSHCGHIQTKCITDPLSRYNQHEYSYTSSNSNFSRTHWQNFALDIIKRTHLKKIPYVLEIGSNDGFLLKQFKNKKIKVLGVDASKYISSLATKNKIKTISGLFDLKLSNKIKKKYKKTNLIIANNVFNHSDNPREFLKSIGNLLDDSGYFIFEVPYWYDGFKSKKFDQVYHEHVSYFTIRSIYKLLKLSFMNIKDIEFVNYHGGSLRIYAQKSVKNKIIFNKIKKYIKHEIQEGIFNKQKYNVFMKDVQVQKIKFLSKVLNLKKKIM